jgi:hypothetical protein
MGQALFWYEFNLIPQKIVYDDIHNLLHLREWHPGGVYVVPLTRSPGINRLPNDKTTMTETEPYEYVPQSILSFIDLFEIKTFYWTITILPPGGSLPIHMDTVIGAWPNQITRMHWPILSNNDAFFEFYDETRTTIIEKFRMHVGHSYCPDVSIPHRIVNDGIMERIHLIANLDIPFNEHYGMVDGTGAYRQHTSQ